jgi:hypothetical protein
MWTWVAIGVGAFVALSAAVTLIVARVLQVIARQVSALHETEAWAVRPLSREADRMESEREEGVAAEEPHRQRGRPRMTRRDS